MPTETLSPPAGTDRVTLYYRQGSSDKVYQASIEPAGAGHQVHFAYGRRGATLQTGTKTARPVDYAAARGIFDQLVREKTAKGYTPGEDGTPYQHTDREQRSTGVLPQLLNPIEEAEVGQFLTNDTWWMQEKFDGRRLLIRKAGTHITAINRTGLTVGLSQPVADAVGSLALGACLLDGEVVGDVFHAFDLLATTDVDLRPKPYSTRYELLVNLVDPIRTTALRYAECATDAVQKVNLLQALRQRRREGVVFKDRTAPYVPGRPASGGSQLKLKFYATASCLVAGASGNKRSVALDLFNDAGHRAGVGSVTIPPNQAIPEVGRIVEVRYLYAFPRGCLYQPVFIGPRDDVPAASCTLGQLKLKGTADADADADSDPDRAGE